MTTQTANEIADQIAQYKDRVLYQVLKKLLPEGEQSIFGEAKKRGKFVATVGEVDTQTFYFDDTPIVTFHPIEFSVVDLKNSGVTMTVKQNVEYHHKSYEPNK